MDRNKIMAAMRQLTEVFTDGDGRNDKALEEVDILSRKLSKLFDFDFKEGESVFGEPERMHVIELTTVEVYFLGENSNWSSQNVGIPSDVAKTQSQDAFIAWLYGSVGEIAREQWSEWERDVVAAYVMSWREDLLAQGQTFEEEALLTRATDGRWKACGQ